MLGRNHLLFIIIVNKYFFRSVSWVRGRDSHIITVDQETFISDGRFVSLKQDKESLWTLKVRISYLIEIPFKIATVLLYSKCSSQDMQS